MRSSSSSHKHSSPLIVDGVGILVSPSLASRFFIFSSFSFEGSLPGFLFTNFLSLFASFPLFLLFFPFPLPLFLRLLFGFLLFLFPLFLLLFFPLFLLFLPFCLLSRLVALLFFLGLFPASLFILTSM